MKELIRKPFSEVTVEDITSILKEYNNIEFDDMFAYWIRFHSKAKYFNRVINLTNRSYDKANKIKDYIESIPVVVKDKYKSFVSNITFVCIVDDNEKVKTSLECSLLPPIYETVFNGNISDLDFATLITWIDKTYFKRMYLPTINGQSISEINRYSILTYKEFVSYIVHTYGDVHIDVSYHEYYNNDPSLTYSILNEDYINDIARKRRTISNAIDSDRANGFIYND